MYGRRLECSERNVRPVRANNRHNSIVCYCFGMVDLEAVVRELRRSGSDTTRIEVKRAAGGFPESLTSTLSALANLPGGGVVILGLDEETGFSPVVLPDPAALINGLVNRARQSFIPPISLTTTEMDFEGHRVIVAEIDETPPSAKPCRINQGGAAYLRFWDGDFQLSEVEVQGFWTSRTQPKFDTEPVPGTTINDLDPILVQSFVESIKDGDQRFRKYQDTPTVLLKSGVLDTSGALTIAGLLALGDAPQQWFPNFVIQASLAPTANDSPDIRIADRARFSGPIPVMIDAAITWTRAHSKRATRENPDSGKVGDTFDLPPLAMRELFANALVHRDLAPWAQSRATEVRLTENQLVLTNPGGLYGVTTDRLGHQQLSSARNAHLLRICQFVRLDDGNAVEALATGIPKILSALATAGLAKPVFFDQALSFTAVIKRAYIGASDLGDPAHSQRPNRPPKAKRLGDSNSPVNLNKPEPRILTAIGEEELTTHQLTAILNISPDAVRKTLRNLLKREVIIRKGGQGDPTTTYRRTGS